MLTRRRFLAQSAATLATSPDLISPYQTPFKYGKLILAATGNKGDFDEKAVDDPIVFRANGIFQMLYIGFDGTGYQTGLATSPDLVHWTREALVGPRDPNSRYTKYNLAISFILRDKNLHSAGDALKVDGQYLAALERLSRHRLQDRRSRHRPGAFEGLVALDIKKALHIE